MLAVSFFSLILPPLETGVGPAVVGAGILLGAAALWALDTFAPHEHFIKGRQGPHSDSVRRIWLFVIAITLHNIPEGLAVGVGFGGGNVASGMPLAIGIGMQNM